MKSPPIPNKRKTLVNSKKMLKRAAFLGYIIYGLYLFEVGVFLYSSNRKASFIITPIHQCRINSISSWIYDKIKIAALRRDYFQEKLLLEQKPEQKLFRW